MKSRFDGYNWVIILERGELLMDSLSKFAKENNVSGGFVSGLGGAAWAELGFYHLDKKQYSWKKFNQLMEVTSLNGNLALKDGEPVWHIHTTLSDENLQAIGGHLKDLEVAGTMELFLHVIISGGLTRSHNDDIGLDLLDLG